jgi:hypothetical protein
VKVQKQTFTCKPLFLKGGEGCEGCEGFFEKSIGENSAVKVGEGSVDGNRLPAPLHFPYIGFEKNLHNLHNLHRPLKTKAYR